MENPSKERPTPPEKKPSAAGPSILVWIIIALAGFFAFSFLLMFGLVFELPLILFFLALWCVTVKASIYIY